MHGRWSKSIIKSKNIAIHNKFLQAIMKTYKFKDQEEAVQNAKLFYEAVKLAWGLQVTYCCHDLIYMIKNDLCYDLYESDNGWGMGLGAKSKMMQMSVLWQRFWKKMMMMKKVKKKKKKKKKRIMMMKLIKLLMSY